MPRSFVLNFTSEGGKKQRTPLCVQLSRFISIRMMRRALVPRGRLMHLSHPHLDATKPKPIDSNRGWRYGFFFPFAV
jgi:hypothetical protein